MLQGKKTYVAKTRGGQLIVRKKIVVVKPFWDPMPSF
jgi:hypothetical protein